MRVPPCPNCDGVAPPPVFCAVTGNLKGYDQLLNLVLDDTHEFLRGAWPSAAPLCCTHAVAHTWTRLTPRRRAASDPDDPLRVTDATRPLGLVVLRGTAVMVVAPTDGTEEIANPFAAAADE